MKIQDIPQTGKMGLTVTWPGGNGLIRRILVTPANPRTDRQLEVRDLLSQQARRFPPHLFGTGCSSSVEMPPGETILFKRSGLK
jgi:hypothetical protein